MSCFKIHPEISVSIATLNCENLSINPKDKIFNIACYILDINPDIIALQEVCNLQAIDEIISLLGNEWKASYHTTPINTSRFHEYMAYIYKSNIKCVGCLTFTDEEKKLYVGKNKIMLRAPLYGRFTVHNKDLLLISYHANQENPILDCQQIKYNINAIQSTNDCKNIVILGDFNTHSNNLHAFRKIMKKQYKPTLSYNINTNVTNKEQYDNIWYHPKMFYLSEQARVAKSPVYVSNHAMVICKLTYKKSKKSEPLLYPPNMTKIMS